MVMTRVTINGVRLPVRGSIRYVMRWVRAALKEGKYGKARMVGAEEIGHRRIGHAVHSRHLPVRRDSLRSMASQSTWGS